MFALAERVTVPAVALAVIVAEVKSKMEEPERIPLSVKNGPPIKGTSVKVQLFEAILVSFLGGWSGWAR